MQIKIAITWYTGKMLVCPKCKFCLFWWVCGANFEDHISRLFNQLRSFESMNYKYCSWSSRAIELSVMSPIRGKINGLILSVTIHLLTGGQIDAANHLSANW